MKKRYLFLFAAAHLFSDEPANFVDISGASQVRSDEHIQSIELLADEPLNERVDEEILSVDTDPEFDPYSDSDESLAEVEPSPSDESIAESSLMENEDLSVAAKSDEDPFEPDSYTTGAELSEAEEFSAAADSAPPAEPVRQVADSQSLEAKADSMKEEGAVCSAQITTLIFSSFKKEKGGEGIVIGKDLFVPNAEAFKKKFSSYIGQCANGPMAEKIKGEVRDYFRSNNYPLVSVSLPSGQDLSSGSIRFVVVPAVLGAEPDSTGARWFSNKKIASEIQAKPGEPINWETLRSDLAWINNNPARNTTVVFEPGKKFGETNMHLVTDDRFPLRVFGGYDHSGAFFIGNSRFIAGIDWSNAFMLDHHLVYQVVTDPTWMEWHAQTLSYIAPLPWRHELDLYGSYTITFPKTSDPLITSQGKGWQICAYYKMPYTVGAWRIIPNFGYEFKRTNNFVVFSEIQVFNNYIDIDQLLLGFEGNYAFSQGFLTLGVTGYFSPGKLSAYNNNYDFQQESPTAYCTYVYVKAKMDFIYRLPWDASLAVNLLFQQASGTLMPSEQFSLGGFTTVRGYRENEIISDSGVLAKVELRSPPIKFKEFMKQKNELQFLGFYDFGYAYHVNPYVVTSDDTNIDSVGPAVRYNLGNWIIARADFGFQLRKLHRIQENSERNYRVHSSIMCSF